MTIDTIEHARASLADAGYIDELVAVGGELRSGPSGRRYAPGDLTVAQLLRFRGISAAEEEDLLFALADADGRPLGTYRPTYRPAPSATDASVIAELHERVISDRDLQAHTRHDHVAAVFADRARAQDAVDELETLGLGSDRLGVALRQGAARAFERDAETDVVQGTEIGVASGAIAGLLAGLSIAAFVAVPGGMIGLGGILALGVPGGLGGAVLGGFLGEFASERSFIERQELDDVPLEPGQVLVAACSHGHAGVVEAVMERHGGHLLLRASD